MFAFFLFTELKYFRDGAMLVISLDGLNWLSKRSCSDKGIKKRDEEFQMLMSSGQMTQADEELQPITCVCILDQKGNAAPKLWRTSDCRSSLVTWAPRFSIPPRHYCLPEGPMHHSAFTSLASFVPQCSKMAPWTRLILNMQDVFSLFKNNLNIVTPQDTVTTDRHNSFIIFCDDDVPPQLFGDTCHAVDCRTSVGDIGWHISDNNVLSDLKNFTAHWPHDPNTNSKGIQHELVSRHNLNTCNLKSLLKSCQIYNAPGVLSGRDKNVKKRKTVCFNDDVTLYLFDQVLSSCGLESPTLELHPGPHTSLSSNYSCNLPEVTLEDSGLEWEDDFSALEKNCHFQCVRHSVSQHYTLSLTTQSCTALPRPEHFFLSQRFLFLTHVTESDLEL
ncbi:class A basic helix-loop-helix protein 15 isoform X1 [Micropterus salmoides]|uniref:class A basic helix-loop-helix protein 15 isoform X1 n=2 Tax=Micropterus salmoides TaxID=27706 RepID=UPI0018ED415E|nr:class A basic helix-loop-helix protein 15 isoform X1 [Micropterus salmoides]XP_038592305.1 class A basic helix-loop-helix protein 15 isoform X1 [Micropterus salmoides]